MTADDTRTGAVAGIRTTGVRARVGAWLSIDDGVNLVEGDRRPFSGPRLPRIERILIALFIGLVSAYLADIAFGNSRFGAKDWTYQWRAGQALLAGQNPYDVIRPAGGYPYESWYMYPFTAVLAALPFATLAIKLGGALFTGFGAAVLAYAVSRDGAGRLWLFLGAPFYVTIGVGQWGPLLMAGVLLTPLAWALTCKPTLGAALFLYRPRWRTVFVCAAFGLLALAVQPTWIRDWLRNAGTVKGHGAPILDAFGWVPALALLRWRKPEARLVGAMAFVPQLLFFYDQLPLMLVARSGRAAFTFAALSWVGWAFAMRACGGAPHCADPSRPWVMWFVYLPVTLYVLGEGLTRRDITEQWRTLRTMRLGARRQATSADGGA